MSRTKFEDQFKGHTISDFLFDEEASIPESRLMTIGSIMVILAFMMSPQDALAGHRSHSSHRSHRSHSSGSHSSGHGNHSSHSSHSSYDHSNHSSAAPKDHASHSNITQEDQAIHSNMDHGGHSSHADRAANPRPTGTPVPPELIHLPQTLPPTLPKK